MLVYKLMYRDEAKDKEVIVLMKLIRLLRNIGPEDKRMGLSQAKQLAEKIRNNKLIKLVFE